MSFRAEPRSARRLTVTVPGNSVKAVDFFDTNPNSVYIRNNGDSTVFIGFHTTPSSRDCDLAVKPGMSKTYGEQNPFPRVLIYNESASPAKIVITSWESVQFDPALLQTDIDLSGDIVDALKFDGIIKGFTSPLPAGSNKIGSVSVDNHPWSAEKIAELLAAVSNAKGCEWTTQNITALLAELETIKTNGNAWTADNVAAMLAALEAIKQNGSTGGGSSDGGGSCVWTAEQVEEVVTVLRELYAFNAGANIKNSVCREAELEAGSNFTITGDGCITSLSNDSGADIAISTLDYRGNTTTTMAVKPGEVLTDVHFAYGFQLIGNVNEICAYRIVYHINSLRKQ